MEERAVRYQWYRDGDVEQREAVQQKDAWM